MADIVIYNTKDGKAAIKLYADNGTVWLTQAQIAELFNKNISTVSRHIANIFDENEVEKSNLHKTQIANSDCAGFAGIRAGNEGNKKNKNTASGRLTAEESILKEL